MEEEKKSSSGGGSSIAQKLKEFTSKALKPSAGGEQKFNELS